MDLGLANKKALVLGAAQCAWGLVVWQREA